MCSPHPYPRSGPHCPARNAAGQYRKTNLIKRYSSDIETPAAGSIT